MIRNVLESIEGVGIYPTISLLIFLALFIGAVVYACSQRKESLDALAELPLKEDEHEKHQHNKHSLR
ncbi:MAG: cbb3-type cytochrome c oxidase subunit 3 [Cytophagales bacterium]|nr:cbb3-type cytochrome c oxidase subunit 3 [Bernardetiaceae bacterium]MDW8210514.1 cbb3-type cytochrome c oxidase subunit 3 [Cytophagales bacterium]